MFASSPHFHNKKKITQFFPIVIFQTQLTDFFSVEAHYNSTFLMIIRFYRPQKIVTFCYRFKGNYTITLLQT